jgi:hypothetical protein
METNARKSKNGNSIVRSLLVLFTCIFLNVPPLTAQEEMQNANPEAAITYLKKEDDALYFIVKVHNPEGDRFSVAINDENGDNLYNMNSRAKQFYQTFKVYIQGNSLNVFVLNKKTRNVVGVFEIKVANKTAEEILVTRL